MMNKRLGVEGKEMDVCGGEGEKNELELGEGEARKNKKNVREGGVAAMEVRRMSERLGFIGYLEKISIIYPIYLF